MSTTLPLFWSLSSNAPTKRLEASAELISTLEQFQSSWTPTAADGPEEEDDEEEEEEDDDDEDDDVDMEDATTAAELKKSPEIKKLEKEFEKRNSEDVRYSIKRLIRGLASPRESSRLGFSVALTELLTRMQSTLSSTHILYLIISSTVTPTSLSRQETRDLLLGRLFGLLSLISSNLLFAPSSTAATQVKEFKTVVSALKEIGDRKGWLKEAAWWGIIKAIQGITSSPLSQPVKDESIKWVADFIFAESTTTWSPEKIGAGLILQQLYPSSSPSSIIDWKTLLAGSFKTTQFLSPSNLNSIARILKESSGSADEDGAGEDGDAVKGENTGSWKARPHFVWDLILEVYFPDGKTNEKIPEGIAKFQDFYRVVIDESLFALTSSPERKFWGFQLFARILPLLSKEEVPLVFTTGFMRVWMNNLAGEERLLYKSGMAVAKQVHTIAQQNPQVGFTLLSQLLGAKGNKNFDKLTKTKTVSSILSSLSIEGIKEYISYLRTVATTSTSTPEGDAISASEVEFDLKRLESTRIWAFEQMLALVKNGAVPREEDDSWIREILEFFIVNGLFAVKRANKNSSYLALQSPPKPAYSDFLHSECRKKLSQVLGELASTSLVIKATSSTKSHRAFGTSAITGELWVSYTLSVISALEQDTKHLSAITESSEEITKARGDALKVMDKLKTIKDPKREETRKGIDLLIKSVLIGSYDEPEESLEVLEELDACAEKMFFSVKAAPAKHKRKTAADLIEEDEEEVELEPMDVLVDVLIGFLERSSSQLRILASQVFGMLSGEVTEGSIDLLLAQLEQRDPTADEGGEEASHEDNEDDEEDEEAEDDEDEDDSASEDDSEDDEEDESGDVDPELRKRIAEALQVNGALSKEGDEDVDEDEDSDDESEIMMDDDQMLALDEKLAAIFKSSTINKKGKKDAQRDAVHFKNRVLDILETFVKKQPTNHLVLRIILPLLEIILNSTQTEQHLSSKATGLLRSKICKGKESIIITDRAEAVEILGELHRAASKAQSVDVANTCSQCSTFVSKALLNDKSAPSSSTSAPSTTNAKPVLDAYLKSLEDFMTKKNTKFHSSFFLDFVKRFPVTAWQIRSQLLGYAKSDSANTYRQSQAFQILNSLLSQVPLLLKADLKSEVAVFIPLCREVIVGVLENSLDAKAKGAMNAARLKDLLKFALQFARSTKSTLATDELVVAWDKDKLASILEQYQTNDYHKSSKALHSLLIQLLAVVSTAEKPAKVKKAASTPMNTEEAVITDTTAKSDTAEVPAKKRKAKKLGEENVGATVTKKKVKTKKNSVE